MYAREVVTRLSSDHSRFQLATGEIPFPEYMDHNIIIMITKGSRPLKPRHLDAPGMTPEVWKIAQWCWLEKPEERPEVNAVLQHLENIANPGMCALTKHVFCPEWKP